MNGRILIVDDEMGPRESLRMILKGKYDLSLAEDGRKALECVEAEDFDLILMDIKMPRMTGIEALQAIKAVRPEVEVLILTGYGSLDTAIRAMQYGAYDYVSKPFDKDDIVRLVEKGMLRRHSALQLRSHRDEVERITTNLKSRYVETVVSLIEKIDDHDEYTLSHSLRVAHLAFHLGLAAGMDPATLQYLRHAGLVHDMGKVLVDGEAMEHHPLLGAMMLRDVLGGKPIVSWIEQHHEHYDGSGYPLGLPHNQTSREAALLIVVNAFDNLLHSKNEGGVSSVAQVMEAMNQRCGQWYDPTVCRYLTEMGELDTLCGERTRFLQTVDPLEQFRLELDQVVEEG